MDKAYNCRLCLLVNVFYINSCHTTLTNSVHINHMHVTMLANPLYFLPAACEVASLCFAAIVYPQKCFLSHLAEF